MEKAALDREFTQKLIDLLAEVTNLTIFLYIENVGVLYSKNMPSFCKKIRDEIDEGICSSLFPANLSSGELKMCHAGLWCRTIPLKIRDGSLAYFTVGHRRIKGKDDE